MPAGAHGGRHGTRDHDIQTKGQAPEVFIAEQHANMARLRGEKDLQIAASNINTEYKKRLDETRDLSSRLENQLASVRSELQHANNARGSLMSTLTEVQRPLQLNIDWANTRRSSRVHTPSAEGVNRALSQTTHDLKTAIEALASELILLDKAIAGLKVAEAKFVAELKAKESTMILDRACLEGMGPTSSVSMDSPRVNRALMVSHGLHTENEWRNQSHASLSGGVVAIEDSMKARKRVAVVVKGIEESGKTKRPAVVLDALTAHSKYESQQITSLKYNAKMVAGEIATLDKHHATVTGTLEKVRLQLQLALQRLGLQVVRPASETTRTGVEEVLEIEVINMQRTEQTLRKQLTELEGKRAKMAALRTKIDSEIAERSKSLDLDNSCTDMTLPTLPQISVRYRASPPQGGATAGSPRSARLSEKLGASPRK